MVGLILAGGLSSRFGRDKALAICPDDAGGLPCLLQAVRLLESLDCLASVAVSCRREQEEAYRCILPSQVRFVFDDDAETREGLGPTPLRGIDAALRALGGPLLVLPCDLPYMRPDTLMELVHARDEAIRQGRPLLRTAFVHPDGVIEGLIAIYEAGCQPFVGDALFSGRIGLYSLVPQDRQALVENAEDAVFWNMNTLEDPQESLSRPRKPWC